jgi:hypothetical protein
MVQVLPELVERRRRRKTLLLLLWLTFAVPTQPTAALFCPGKPSAQPDGQMVF